MSKRDQNSQKYDKFKIFHKGNIDHIETQINTPNHVDDVHSQIYSEAERVFNENGVPDLTDLLVTEINAEVIQEQYERSDPKGQWSFSKYMGLLLIDKLMSGSADQFAQLVYLYATSQSRESAPFYKVS